MIESGEYDGVVLGENPTGLWAAKQMITRGFKMLVICTGTSGLNHFLPKPVADDFKIKSARTVRDLQPLQILTPAYRFRAFQNEEQFKQEFEFQFGKPLIFSERPDPSFLRGLAYWVRGAESGPVFAEEFSVLYSKFFETIYYDEEPGFVTQSLLQELEDLGAHIIRPGNLQRIFVDRKNFVGVQLANNTKMISVKQAFINTHLDFLNSFFSEPMQYVSQPLGWTYQIQFECAVDALPVGLTDRMIYVEENAPILEIFQERPGFFRLKTTLSFQDHTLDRTEQRRLATRMLKVCEGIIPDLEYNLKKITPDLRDPERAISVDLPAMYPFQDLRRVPSHLLTFASGGGAAPASPAQGMWVTHEEAIPKETLWGGFEAAKSALKAIDLLIAKTAASESNAPQK